MKLFNYLYFKLPKHDIKFLIAILKREIEDESNEDVYVYVCCQVLNNLEEYVK